MWNNKTIKNKDNENNFMMKKNINQVDIRKGKKERKMKSQTR